MIRATTLCQQFVECNRWNYEESTIGVFRLAFHNFVQAIGNREITQIEAMDGERFKGYVVKTERCKSTANIWLRAIKRVFNWAVETQLLKRNPLSDIKQFRLTRNPVKAYSDAKVMRMIEFAPDLRWKGIIICAWTTGLRRGAILNLTRDNIRDGFVHVEAKKKSETTWPWEPKTKEIRMVPMVSELKHIIDSLDCYYPFIARDRYEYLLSLQKSGILSARQRKCPVENIRRDLVRIQKRAFGRQVGDFHMFRKTFTTNMAEVLPEHIVMSLTGHTCRNTLTHYTAVRRQFYEQALKIASERLKKAPRDVGGPLGIESDFVSHLSG